jgi:hypothetical protein
VAAAPPDDLADIPDGTPLTEIAAHYRVTVAVARRWVTTAGLPPTPQRARWPPRYDTARIVKLYAEWRTEVEVAAEVGCAVTTVSKYVREAGLGRGRSLHRLDTSEVIRRYQAGQTLTEVAAAVGASARVCGASWYGAVCRGGRG